MFTVNYLMTDIFIFVPVQPVGKFVGGVYTPHSSATGGAEQILVFFRFLATTLCAA